MKYYVTADTHSFYSELKAALTEKGFFKDKEPHKLIICGDLFDRGEESLELQAFIFDLMAKDEVILVKGNHEDLLLALIKDWNEGAYREYHHKSNGTISTVLQLTESDPGDLLEDEDIVYEKLIRTPFVNSIIPAMVDYYETEHYIFVHGWIPCLPMGGRKYRSLIDWRTVDKGYWEDARWINGMEAHHGGVMEQGKTIVCGHWHCSYGHSQFEGNGGEFEDNPNFNPYYAKGIIALDACTAFSEKVNVIVIED